MSNFFIPSVFRQIQDRRSLRFTANGDPGDTLSFDVPSIEFQGDVLCSGFYKIGTGSPVTGEEGVIQLQNPPNSLSFGIYYTGTNEGRFYASLNTSRFETPILFDADTYSDWMHFAFYVDWTAPSDSLFFWNNTPYEFTTRPAANSTQFTPIGSAINLANIVAGVEWAHIWCASASGVANETNFIPSILPRFSTRTASSSKPYGLGKRGGVVYQRPWIYLSFYDKLDENGDPYTGIINDANGAPLNFGTFTGYEINKDPDNEVVLPLEGTYKRLSKGGAS